MFFSTVGWLVGIFLMYRGDEPESLGISISWNSGRRINSDRLRPVVGFLHCSTKSPCCVCCPWGCRKQAQGIATRGSLSWAGHISIQTRLIGSSSRSGLVLIFVRFHGQSWILLPVCSIYKPKPVLMLYSQLLVQGRQEAQACWAISTACLATWHPVRI